MEEIKGVLSLINSGMWLQMEGSVGRMCNQFLESEEIIVDTERTKKEGTISFIDGYGRNCKQPYFKIDWVRVDEVELEVELGLYRTKNNQ
jgi:hypothetical protein